MKSYNNINFSTRRRKRWIQTFFYSSSKVVRSNVLMLCGPDLESHVADFRLINNTGDKCFLDIYELDIDTWKRNGKDLKNYTNLPINIFNDNIINAKARRFVDLDFCTSLYTSFPIIEKIYNEMKDIKPHKNRVLYKHLLITFSVRDGYIGTKLEDSIQSLCNLFGISNNFKKLCFLPKQNIMKHKTKDCMYSTYRDGMPMCTFSFQWK